MENEIKVGEYCRTRNGLIAKLIEPQVYEINDEECIEFLEDIVKHSSNLIDLIQCGDYVNREKVEKIAEPSLANDYNRLIYCNECEGLYKLILFNKDIKEIVTKEMMESISYKVTKM